MIWHLIAAIFAGLGAAGIGLILRLASAKRLPKWIIPVCAGLGMLGYQIHYEYSWFDHKRSQLPATTRVVDTKQDSMPWRPWTYFYPMTVSFSVVDQGSMVPRQADDQQLVEFILYRFEKEYVDQLHHQPYLLNCSSAELVPLAKGSRQPRVDALRTLDEESSLYQAVCSTV
ncbi:hypothetical protein OCT51_05175 [Halomonas sp. LR3S48]|uniref:hypothetical protein n=1 Tax=Halomonas sp. LR3S48 TaxID=2982694 RepID=UPI0021E40979|nr:hypothetical protein [Halomonas sp. LR3S48]UYG04765.1 hypothetical protein OCT51_05175 [Halomonas sp. LR3S48]